MFSLDRSGPPSGFISRESALRSPQCGRVHRPMRSDGHECLPARSGVSRLLQQPDRNSSPNDTGFAAAYVWSRVDSRKMLRPVREPSVSRSAPFRRAKTRVVVSLNRSGSRLANEDTGERDRRRYQRWPERLRYNAPFRSRLSRSGRSGRKWIADCEPLNRLTVLHILRIECAGATIQGGRDDK
jgi:hypothetical protein